MRSLLLTFALATAAAFAPHAQARRHRTCQASVSKPAVVRVAESPAMFGGGKSATPRVAKKVVKKPVAKKVVKKVVAKRVVKKVVAKRVVKKVVAKRVVKKVVAKQVVKKVVPKKVVKKIVKRVVAKKAVQTKVAKPSDNFFVNFFKPKSLKSSQPAATVRLTCNPCSCAPQPRAPRHWAARCDAGGPGSGRGETKEGKR